MKKQSNNVKQTSLDAFHDKENKEVRETHTQSIITFLKSNPLYIFSARTIAKNIALPRMSVVRRMSEIEKMGIAKVARVATEEGQKVSLYQYDPLGIPQKAQLSKFELLQTIIKDSLSADQYDKIMEKYLNKKSN